MSTDSDNDEKSKEIQGELFELPKTGPGEPRIAQLRYPVWTENKARFIELYLYYFVLITKHGTYIDGFAGPQRPDSPEMWAAKLVLESEPKWLRHFYLFDDRRRQAERLEALRAAQPSVKGRAIHIFHGDFNTEIVKLLRGKEISQREATLCLLDQRTFECHWETLVHLATYKEKGTHKIELFYFLASAWLPRALSSVKDTSLLEKWWGREDWPKLKEMAPEDIKKEVVRRFKSELGYMSVKEFPIYDHKGGGRIMYYMIHATDHPVAPHLMPRAYNRAIQPRETPEQFLLSFQQEREGFRTDPREPD